MKAAMELEYVVKFMILLVVLVTVIGIISVFYNDIQEWWCKTIGTCGDEPVDGKTQVIKQSIFTASDVAKYVDSCWFMTGEEYNDDLVCYVLQGGMEVDEDQIAGLLRSFPAARMTVKTDFRGDSVVITFLDIGNKIELS